MRQFPCDVWRVTPRGSPDGDSVVYLARDGFKIVGFGDYCIAIHNSNLEAGVLHIDNDGAPDEAMRFEPERALASADSETLIMTLPPKEAP